MIVRSFGGLDKLGANSTFCVIVLELVFVLYYLYIQLEC